MNNTKKQHYIPIFYLKNFSTPIKKGFYINVFEKERLLTLEKQNIRNIASENYFYDLDFESIRKHFSKKEILKLKVSTFFKSKGKLKLSDIFKKNLFENYLADIESFSGDAIKKVIANIQEFSIWEVNNCFCIDENEKRNISLFLAIQFIRTPKNRKFFKDMHEVVIPQVYEDLIYRTNNEDVSVYINSPISEKERAKAYHLSFLLDPTFLNDLSERFYNHLWVFYLNKTESLFYTSDSIISVFNRISNPIISTTGINSFGVEIIIPLSPTILLVLYEKEYHAKAMQKDHKKIKILENITQVDSYNQIIIQNSYKYIFSQNLDFHLAKNLCTIYDSIRFPKQEVIFANPIKPKTKE
ncbi:hypothetical protein M2475_001845 [Breznakia sp. PF5-3]|uniref:DUF4238 domain-containing protein n=1 Tax=unclassified Breznakia TaxID=2623764 RepID=UPI002406A8DA|nr:MULTISPECIES: DUF4238 domain-containing protein [unclassified Breznakia]MDF9825390.1 hypothetical protein [Breznakia sp. PM6-1]MDF9836268.1 hypothetical protein [Breznakia sp. PF5-3]MDF9837580.1 hypothetical protein [Breznakia sp. PFB2-8]MDF9860193.1 hypothetical protein [Breznakia sp. PH5-24]